jgi:hypothetical protein
MSAGLRRSPPVRRNSERSDGNRPPKRNARQVEAVTTKVVLVTALDASRVQFFARENAGAPIPPRAGFANRFAGQLIFFSN